jgi:hypothetical protein
LGNVILGFVSTFSGVIDLSKGFFRQTVAEKMFLESTKLLTSVKRGILLVLFAFCKLLALDNVVVD